MSFERSGLLSSARSGHGRPVLLSSLRRLAAFWYEMLGFAANNPSLVRSR